MTHPRAALAGVDMWPRFAYCLCVTVLEERRIKLLLKDAVVEVLTERQDLLREALQESLEAMAMLRAIQVGERTQLKSRKQIFRRLERAR